MRKKILAIDLPEQLTPEIIEILAEMANEFPKTSFEWNDVSVVLENRGQLRIVLDRALELQREEKSRKQAAMTNEEKNEEAEKVKNSLKSSKFSGNMGEPEKY
jgi:hypothetical protein